MLDLLAAGVPQAEILQHYLCLEYAAANEPRNFRTHKTNCRAASTFLSCTRSRGFAYQNILYINRAPGAETFICRLDDAHGGKRVILMLGEIDIVADG